MQAGEEQKATNAELEASRASHHRVSDLLQQAKTEGREMKHQLAAAVDVSKEAQTALKDAQFDLQRLESEKKAWTKRETKLEKDKAALHAKLESTISALEERTSATIERATSKLQDRDQKVRAAETRAATLEEELAAAREEQAAAAQAAAHDAREHQQALDELRARLQALQPETEGHAKALADLRGELEGALDDCAADLMVGEREAWLEAFDGWAEDLRHARRV